MKLHTELPSRGSRPSCENVPRGVAAPVGRPSGGECRQRDKPIPRDLWHALIFYTTGEVIKPIIDPQADAPENAIVQNGTMPSGSSSDRMPDANNHSSKDAEYTPYAMREGLYQRGWENY